MFEGDGLETLDDNQLDREILRWFNDRMIEMINMFLDLGDDSGWDEDYLQICFPRNFVEDNREKCRSIILDIKDVLSSDFIFDNMKLLHKYVLFHIIENQIDIIEDFEEFEKDFLPIPNKLVQRIYNARGYIYNECTIDEEDENHPSNFISSLQSIDIFYDNIFDDTEFDIDYCNAWVISCINKMKNKEWMPYDLEPYFDLVSRSVKEEYIKLVNDNSKLDIDDEKFIIQEVDSALKLLFNRIKDIETYDENKISNYIELMLKRLLYLNRRIEIGREALIGYSSVKMGEADMLLYRNSDGYENIAIIECKMFNTKFKEFKQLLGYLNINFNFGITISINRESKMEIVSECIHRYLESNSKDLGIIEVKKESEYLICSRCKIPENTNKVMNFYHFILNLNQEERIKWAREARE